MNKKKLVLTASLVVLVAAAILAIALVITFNANGTAFAEQTLSKGGTESGTVEVKYKVDDTWTVTIPDSLDLSSGSTSNTVSASEVKIEQGKQLTVTVESENTWQVKDSSGENGFRYELKADSGAAFTAKGDSGENVVLTVEAGTATGEASLSAEIKDDKAGNYSTGGEEYTDTLTFNVEVKDQAA